MNGVVISDAKPTGYNDPLTEEEVENIISLKRDELLSVSEISEETGKSISTIRRYLSRNGISDRTRKIKTPPLSEEQFKTVRSFKKRGTVSSDAAKRMEVSLAEVNLAYGAPTYDYYVNHR